MKTPEEIMRDAEDRPALERAAVIAHEIYTSTAERVGWGSRVPENWDDLSEAARRFNCATIETWVDAPELFEAWCEAVHQLRRGDAPRSP